MGSVLLIHSPMCIFYVSDLDIHMCIRLVICHALFASPHYKSSHIRICQHIMYNLLIMNMHLMKTLF